MAEIIVHARAARYFDRMDARTKSQVKGKLLRLGDDPEQMPGVKPMAGEWAGFFRLRHGDLRIIFLHDRLKNTIVIAHIGPRGDVYK